MGERKAGIEPATDELEAAGSPRTIFQNGNRNPNAGLQEKIFTSNALNIYQILENFVLHSCRKCLEWMG